MIAPKAHIVLQTGGYIITNYTKDKPLFDSSSIRLDIINYLEHELLTFKVKLNNQFAKQVQREDSNLQEVIQFEAITPDKTKIKSSILAGAKVPNGTRLMHSL